MDGAAAETKRPEIYAALAKMIAAVGVVGKNRKNAAQGYQFRGIDDVLSACQGVLAEHGVVCVPRVVEREREVVATKNGGSMASVRLLVDHTFFARDGSFVVCTTLGEAMDSGDKASNKAMSAALKYALVETLCIPTFEDERDTETASPEMAAPTPQSGKPPTTAAATKAPAQSKGGQKSAPRPSQGASGAVFPNYGTAKNTAVAGASVRDLEFYRGGCLKTLADPSKANWHARDQALLAAIDDELSRHSGNAAEAYPDEPPPPGDDDRQF